MPNPIIPPTVGRVLWFYPSEHTGEAGFVRHAGGGGPYAAIIAHVWSDSMLNLTVFDANGTPHSRTSVPLIQDGDVAPDHAFCGWMPFQKGQAAKQESEANQQTAQSYVPRTFRQDLEQAAVHAMAGRVAEQGYGGAKIGAEVRQALDALLEKDGGTAPLIGLPVRDDHRNEDVVHFKAQAAQAPVTEQELAAKAVAPRVTPLDLEAEVASEHYFTAREGVLGMLAADGVPPSIYEQANAAPQPLGLLTFCVLVLNNGFTVTGESACASPDNFDPAIGRRLARDHALGKLWPLLGFRLRDALHEIATQSDDFLLGKPGNLGGEVACESCQ